MSGLENITESFKTSELDKMSKRGSVCGTIFRSTYNAKYDGTYDFSKVRSDLNDKNKQNCCMENLVIKNNINYIVDELEKNPDKYELKTHDSVHLWHGSQPMMVLESNNKNTNGISLCMDVSHLDLKTNKSILKRLANFFIK